MGKGERGREAAGKSPVFGLLKRDGKVYAVPVSNAKAETLLPIIRKTVKLGSIVYIDCLSSYDIHDVSEFVRKTRICGSLMEQRILESVLLQMPRMGNGDLISALRKISYKY